MNDSHLVGCPICKGKKMLVGLGSFPEKCHECHGVGWVEAPLLAEESEKTTNENYKCFENEEQNVKPAKKTGRPKKDKTD